MLVSYIYRQHQQVEMWIAGPEDPNDLHPCSNSLDSPKCLDEMVNLLSGLVHSKVLPEPMTAEYMQALRQKVNKSYLRLCLVL